MKQTAQAVSSAFQSGKRASFTFQKIFRRAAVGETQISSGVHTQDGIGRRFQQGLKTPFGAGKGARDRADAPAQENGPCQARKQQQKQPAEAGEYGVSIFIPQTWPMDQRPPEPFLAQPLQLSGFLQPHEFAGEPRF